MVDTDFSATNPDTRWFGTVREVMSKEVMVVPPQTSLRQVAASMRSADAGFVAIADASGPIGVVTDRDLVVRGLARDADPDSASVTEIMTPNLATVMDSQAVEHAARLMRDRRIRRVLVLDDGNQIAGIITLGDLVAAGVPLRPIADVLAVIDH